MSPRLPEAQSSGFLSQMKQKFDQVTGGMSEEVRAALVAGGLLMGAATLAACDESGEVDTNKTLCPPTGCDSTGTGTGGASGAAGEGGSAGSGAAGTGGSLNSVGGSSGKGGTGGNPAHQPGNGGTGGSNNEGGNGGNTPNNCEYDTCGDSCCSSVAPYCSTSNVCVPCPDNKTYCTVSNECVDTTKDEDNCGGCGLKCNGSCVNSTCQ